MKLILSSLALLLPAAVNGAVSQPECKNWTQAHLFDTNPSLQPAEDAYAAQVAGVLEANCLDESGPTECKLGLGQSDTGDAYADECTVNGGKMWTYTLHPLCGDISSTSQTEITGVKVCASASCEDIGVANLIPNQKFYEPFVAAGYSCGSGTSNLEKDKTEDLNSQPECYDWTQMHNYATNPDMQPAEDAYFQYAADILEATCLTGDEFTGCGTISLSNSEGSTGDAYITECHKTGGHVWSYTVSPLCGNYSSSNEAGTVSDMLVCASASCELVGVTNLIPPVEAIYAPFNERNISCGSATSDVKKVSVPSTTDDGNAGQNPSGASFILSWMPFVSILATLVV